MNEDTLYEKVIQKLFREMGVIGGVSVPLGAGPKASGNNEEIYKDSNATDDEHRSNTNRKNSVQYVLKNN